MLCLYHAHGQTPLPSQRFAWCDCCKDQNTMEHRAVFFQCAAAADHVAAVKHRDDGDQWSAICYARFAANNFIYSWVCRFGTAEPEVWA